MPALISRYATRLLKLRVDEIEVRAHARNADGSRQAIRLVASSMAGQWLKTDGYLEYLDPVTGATQAYCSVGDDEACFIEPYPVASSLATKRSIARRIGTTYAYDFLGLIEKALVQDWQAAIADGRASAIPAPLLEVDELLLGADGVLSRAPALSAPTTSAWSAGRRPSRRPSTRRAARSSSSRTTAPSSRAPSVSRRTTTSTRSPSTRAPPACRASTSRATLARASAWRRSSSPTSRSRGTTRTTRRAATSTSTSPRRTRRASPRASSTASSSPRAARSASSSTTSSARRTALASRTSAARA